MNVKLVRYRSDAQGTFGIIFFDWKYLYTGELPWRDNKRNLSCIPPGNYTVGLRSSPKYGNVYEVKRVPERSYILFHQGNFCGDKSLGYRTNVQGCILLGFKRGKLYGQEAVLQSRDARDHFERTLEFETFNLEIIDVTGTAY